MRRAIPSTCLALVMTAGPALAAEPYLSDLLKEPAYRASFAALFGGAESVPDWITTFAETSNGVVTPGSDVSVGGETYQYASVCKPHDCENNTLGVLFAQGGSKARAILEVTGAAPQFFGAPDAGVEAALTAQVGK